MTNRQKTILVIGAAATGLIAWDVWVVLHEPAATISGTFLDAAERHGTWALLYGILGGHFTWPVRGGYWPLWERLAGVALGLLMCGAAWLVIGHPVLCLGAGFAASHVTFPQFEADK